MKKSKISLKAISIASFSVLLLSACHTELNEKVDELNNKLDLPMEFDENKISIETDGSDVVCKIVINDEYLDTGLKEAKKELNDYYDDGYYDDYYDDGYYDDDYNYGRKHNRNDFFTEKAEKVLKISKETYDAMAEEGSDLIVTVKTKGGLDIAKIKIDSDFIEYSNKQLQ